MATDTAPAARPVVIVDVEATGLNDTRRDHIWEVAIIRHDHTGRREDTFQIQHDTGLVADFRRLLLDEVDLHELSRLDSNQRRARLERVIAHLVSREGIILSTSERNRLIRRVVDERVRSLPEDDLQNILLGSARHLDRNIQLLEEELGVELLSRSHRPVRLTEAGRLFQEQALQILGRVEQMAEATRRVGKLLGAEQQ